MSTRTSVSMHRVVEVTVERVALRGSRDVHDHDRIKILITDDIGGELELTIFTEVDGLVGLENDKYATEPKEM